MKRISGQSTRLAKSFKRSNYDIDVYNRDYGYFYTEIVYDRDTDNYLQVVTWNDLDDLSWSFFYTNEENPKFLYSYFEN